MAKKLSESGEYEQIPEIDCGAAGEDSLGREPKVRFAKAPKAAKVRRGTLQPSVAAPPLCEL